MPQIANLLVRASAARTHEELKQELIQQASARGLPFGLLLRSLLPGSTQGADPSGMPFGGERPRTPLGAPVLAWKVFPDGREELVRGLSFGAASLRDLRDISAAGKETSVLSRTGSSSAPAPFSVVAPEVLFPELELRPDGGATPKPALLSNPYFERNAAGKAGKK